MFMTYKVILRFYILLAYYLVHLITVDAFSYIVNLIILTIYNAYAEMDGVNDQRKRTLFGPRREKICLRGFVYNTGADQPAHPRSLISAFVIRVL